MKRTILVLIAVLLLAIPLSAQDEMMLQMATVNDQVSLDGTVLIEYVAVGGPGFIVIHADNGSGGPGPVIGHQMLIPGENFNVRVEIDPLLATPTLFAMLHSDTGEVGVYEFGTVEGADGPVQDADGNVITPPFNVDIIYAHDQFVSGSTVTIASVVAQVDGWMVIHQINEQGGPGPVAGFAPVSAGTNLDVAVTLDMNDPTDVMYPMLHVDTGAAGTYEFGTVEGADGPVRVNDRVAVLPIWTVPHMRVSDQIVTYSDGMSMDMAPTLTADSVLAADAGWLVVHSESDGSPGPVAGFAPVSAGMNLDVVVELDPAVVTPRLWPMLHLDTDAMGEYEFGTVEGADSPVRDSSGNVITFGINAAPSIIFQGTLGENTLSVTQALSDSTGWLVIHADGGGSPGPVLGQWPVRPGINRGINVTLDSAAAGTLVFPMLHHDTGEAGVYEFGAVEGADLPVFVGGNVVVGPMPLETLPVDDMAEEDSEAAPEAMAGCQVSSSGTVNLRGGPGTNYNIAGSLNAGTVMNAVGQAQGADGFVWWSLDDGSWVRSDVVNEAGECETLPAVAAPPPPAAPAEPVAPPAPAATEEV